LASSLFGDPDDVLWQVQQQQALLAKLPLFAAWPATANVPYTCQLFATAAAAAVADVCWPTADGNQCKTQDATKRNI
jgi:hypothetical protein